MKKFKKSINRKLKKINRNFKKIAKENIVFRKIYRASFNMFHRIKFNIRGIGIKPDSKTVVFSTFQGKTFADNPKAIYLHMLSNPLFKDYKFIWAFKNAKKYRYLKENPNTDVVKIKSKKYEKALHGAKYWITNHRISDYVYPSKKQVYLQCWHGTPLKRLGFDLEKLNNAINTANDMKIKYRVEAKKFTAMVSPSHFATEKFISCFNLEHMHKQDCIIESGYPRNDFLYNYTEEDIKGIKKRLGIESCNKKIILYAPTWRDNQHTLGKGYTYKSEVDFEKLQKELQDDHIILFRAHYFVSNSFDFEKYQGFIYDVSSFDDINELYVIADMLITDYSSVFFDYANLKRPIAFYMYDLEAYRDDIRGFYINLDELPGNILRTEEELIEEIKSIESNWQYNEKYVKFNNKYNYLDDGNASERVVETIFKN